MIYKFLAAVLLLTSSISGYDSETGYENGVIRSQMQKLMSGFVNTVDYAKNKNLWYDHYNYLHSIMVLADNDVMYYDDTVDGGWSTWYPLSECLTISSGDMDEKLAFRNNLTKLQEQENWKRPEGKKRRSDLPTLLSLSYKNEKRTNHKWTAQLRVRYCTEELPMHGGEKCKGGNGIYETKVFYFREWDAEYIKTLPRKRPLRLDYCNLDDAFMQLRKIKHKSKKRLRTAVRLQSTYYDLI